MNKEIERNLNNFDLIRLIAAATVIVSHSYDLLGLGVPDILFRSTAGKIGFSDLGVWSFFIISGFLIDKSSERARNALDYYWNENNSYLSRIDSRRTAISVCYGSNIDQ